MEFIIPFGDDFGQDQMSWFWLSKHLLFRKPTSRYPLGALKLSFVHLWKKSADPFTLRRTSNLESKYVPQMIFDRSNISGGPKLEHPSRPAITVKLMCEATENVVLGFDTLDIVRYASPMSTLTEGCRRVNPICLPVQYNRRHFPGSNPSQCCTSVDTHSVASVSTLLKA
ncbi:hypothetical protein H5410_017037 [Solanum commersonii]|uniref:Uncharacterized protein n=1 Tax=Solanum commersonii TaxID=4109 RepID=A0A9J5ZXZ2_SOLCO|nr:hypothetical protein H5410_017037 [Solanum commersonii]